MSKSVLLQENHQSIIERWKASSPFEQERLEILKKVIEEGKEKELYDPREQEKFGLEEDEFLVYVHSSRSSFNKFLWYRLLVVLAVFCPLGFIIIINSNIEELSNDLLFLACFLFFMLFIQCSDFLKIYSNKIIFVTNKNIYHGIENKYGYKISYMEKISLSDISIESYMCELEYNNYNMFPLYSHVMKDGKILFEIFIYKNSGKFNKKHNIVNKEYSINYVLKAMSCISQIYNIPLYIYQIHSGISCSGSICIYRVFPFVYVKCKESIEQEFSKAIDLARYLASIRECAELNREKIVRLLQNEPLADEELHKELCRIPAKESFIDRGYDICLSKNNIWIEHNGKLTMEKFCISDVEIYDHEKYFIFLFTYRGYTTSYYANKENINFPFVDIIKLLFNKKIEYISNIFIESPLLLIILIVIIFPIIYGIIARIIFG